MVRELIIPDAAIRDADAKEMARVWIAEKGLHCSLLIGTYANRQDVDERVAWGVILADLARHAARALSDAGGASPDAMLAAIQEAFLEEIEKPTSSVRGGFSAAAPDEIE